MSEGTFEQQYFLQKYRHYVLQNPPKKLAFYRSMIQRHLSPKTSHRIDDIGCAFGRFLGSLDDTWELHGSDISQFAIDQATENLPQAHFKVATCGTPNVFSGIFGVVTAFDVIEHVPDLHATTSAIHQQLEPGGLFTFVVPVYDGLSGPIIKLLDKDETHLHKWPRRQWLTWASADFEVLEWQGITRYLLPGGYYLHQPTTHFRNHTPAIIVVCRKRP